MLFDCDGVLVDSEPITNGVLRDMLEECGWSLSPGECMRLFVGKAVKDESALIEARTGQPITELTRPWRMLTTRQLRRTPRVAAFFDFVAKETAALRPILTG